MAAITLEQVSRVHEDGTAALDGVDLSVGDGEFLGIVGPSGAGKTTLLRVIAGLEPVSSGVVRIGGSDMAGTDLRNRNIAMVSQSRTLLSFLDVAGNVALPLEMGGVDQAGVADRTGAERRALRLGGVWRRKPRSLSAGTAQRAALARALVRDPAALLADEPLQLLDPPTQRRLRQELFRIQSTRAMTMIYTTNDHWQVLGVADRVAVIRHGRIVQVDTPTDLLRRPRTAWVAGFVGEPAMTLLPARIGEQGGLGRLWIGDQWIRFPGGLPGALRDRVGQSVLLGARPNGVVGTELGDPADRRLDARVVGCQRLGPHDLAEVSLAGGTWTATFPTDRRVATDQRVEITVDVRALSVYSADGEHALWHGQHP